MRYGKETWLPGVAFAAIPAALAGPNQDSGNHHKAAQNDVKSAAGRSDVARNDVELDFTQVGPVVNWTFAILREEVENSLQTDFQRFQLKADNSRSYISRSFFKRRHQ